MATKTGALGAAMIALPMIALSCLGGCGGEQVALNERVLSAVSMESRGAGCYLYLLGGGEKVSSEAGAVGGGLVLRQRLDGDEVVVSVNEGARTLVERRYGESFFRSETVEELTATPTSGGEALLLRYWGRFHPNGIAGCAPLEDPGR